MAKIIGLTGGIATGKSTVAGFFKDANIPVIETDQIAKSVLAKGSDVFQRVVEHFGDAILLSEGTSTAKRWEKSSFKMKMRAPGSMLRCIPKSARLLGPKPTF